MNKNSPKTAARGRPRRTPTDTAEMRDRIMRAARDLFARAGYEGVSMRKLATEAGCAPAALYAYFPNKRAVLRVLWEDVFGELGNVLRQEIDAQHDPLVRLHALITATTRFWLDRPQDFRAIFLIQDEPQGPDGTYFADEPGVIFSLGLILEAARAAADSGLTRIQDADRIMSICIAGINGIALNLITVPEYDWGEKDAVVEDAATTIINGLKAS